MAANKDATTYILGTLPPPLGGVTVFLYRRTAQLRNAGQPYRVMTWNRMTLFQRLGWLLNILLNPRAATYEVNGLETQTMLALALRPFPKTIVYWVHSGQFTARLNSLQRFVFHRFLAQTDECVMVSKHIYAMFDENGFRVPENNRVQYAFLAPPLEDEPKIWATYDAPTQAFVDAHYPLVVMQGADAFHNGYDRYGTDLAAEMIGLLHERHPNIGLLVGRPSEGDAHYQAYMADLMQQIDSWGVRDNIHFMTGERELWPLMKRADIFVRPSNQDGDSVSVREAMMFDTPVVASDACPRPDVVTLFKNRDAADFARAMETVIATLPPRPARPAAQADRPATVRPATPLAPTEDLSA